MDERNSYNIKTIANNVYSEIERLKHQVELFWNKELKHYIEFGLKDGMSIVELGSGPGFVTEKICSEFTNSNIVSVEIDPFLIEYAEKNVIKKYSDRCKVIEKSIMNTGLPENKFDFAIIRLVLEHLPDPINAAREVFRLLKPGGKAVFVDNDFQMHIMTYPHIDELNELYDAYCKSRYEEGGNPRIGRELPNILSESGFSNLDFEVISVHSKIVSDEVFFKSEGIGIPVKLVKDGFLSSKTLAQVSLKWSDVIKDKKHAVIRQLYMAVGEKNNNLE